MSPRPAKQVPLVTKIAQAFEVLGKLQRRGKNRNRRYAYPRAADVFQLARRRLLALGVLILPSEEKAEYVPIATTNGAEQLTECRLHVTFLITDGLQALPLMKANGVGRDVEDKALYKAKTGAEKYLVKQLALMVEIFDDPEWDGAHEAEYDAGEILHDAPPPRATKTAKTVTIAQIHTFNSACSETNKTQDEILGYLMTTHRVSKLADLGRGKPFTEALRWAQSGTRTSAPKLLATPAVQGSLPLPRPTPPIELRIGNQTVTVEPNAKSYAL